MAESSVSAFSRCPVFAKPSCGARGGDEILAALGEVVAELGLEDRVSVTGATCLGPCDNGPTVVVYPEGIWYRGVVPADAAEIARSHARDGKPVERLLFEWPDMTADSG